MLLTNGFTLVFTYHNHWIYFRAAHPSTKRRNFQVLDRRLLYHAQSALLGNSKCGGLGGDQESNFEGVYNINIIYIYIYNIIYI